MKWHVFWKVTYDSHGHAMFDSEEELCKFLDKKTNEQYDHDAFTFTVIQGTLHKFVSREVVKSWKRVTP